MMSVQVPSLTLFAVVLTLCIIKVYCAESHTSNYDSSVVCHSSSVAYPRSTQEVSELIKQAVANAQKGINTSVRVSRPQFHTSNGLACPQNVSQGLSSHLYLSNMSAVRQVDMNNKRLTVEAGMLLSTFLALLKTYNWTLEIESTPIYDTFMLGALIANAVHGTNAKGKALFSDNVINVTYVNGNGEIKHTDDLSLVSGGMGLTGVITELSIQAGPARKTRAITRTGGDANATTVIPAMVEETPHLMVVWRPDHKKLITIQMSEVPTDTPGNASFAWLATPPTILPLLRTAVTTAQLDVFDDQGSNGSCTIIANTDMAWVTGDGRSGILISGEQTHVGWSNDVATGTCFNESSCMWSNAQVTLREVVLDTRNLTAFMEDVRKVMEKMKGCLPFGFGFWMRFAPPSGGLLSPSHGRPSVFIEMAAMQTANLSLPIKQQDFYEEVEQLALCKYQGRVHWGKSTNRMLTSKCSLRDAFPEWDKFEASRKVEDPLDIFVPEMYDRMNNRKGHHYYPGCAIKNDCYCQEDIHCQLNGDERFRCVPGAVFSEYKVCKAVKKSAIVLASG